MLHSDIIPSFIRARTPQRLRKLMLEVQVRAGARYTWSDIQHVDGFWYAWFIPVKNDTEG